MYLLLLSFYMSTVYRLINSNIGYRIFCSGEAIKVVLWGSSAVEFNGTTIRTLGQSESAVAIFVGTTVRDYPGISISSCTPASV